MCANTQNISDCYLTGDLDMKLFLAPYPKKVLFNEQKYFFKGKGKISIDERNLFKTINVAKKSYFNTYNIVIGESDKSEISFFRKDGIADEGYELKITQEGIRIYYSDYAGAFYGFSTLNQIREQCLEINCVEIYDFPDFSIRGYMWDVARCKIPKLSTILDMVDRLSSFKINHLELYMEGAPFEYSSHPEMWNGIEVLTGEELMIIDEYCKERFIDFVPTHNTFGHMTAWLEKMPRDMSICPDGFYYEPWKTHFKKPASLNPFNPKSIEFVKEISEDLLKYFSSSNFNICCDEVLELGSGLTEGMSSYDLGKTYFEFLMKIYDFCQEKGKKMFFWGDILSKHSEFIKELPKNIMALNWGYESNEPTEESCIDFENANIPYCVCPGTGTWKTFTGKTRQMKENISGAVEKGKIHNASGVILTDWGDCGHLQGWATVFPGIVYAASLSWNYQGNKELDIGNALDLFVYKAKGVGEFSLKVGNYHTMEPIHLINQTLSEKLLFNNIEQMELSEVPCLWECISHTYLDSMIDYMDICLKELNLLDLGNISNGDNIRDEYAVGIETVKLAQYIGHYKLYLHEQDIDGQREVLKIMSDMLPRIIGEFRRSWTVKNKYSRLDDALNLLKSRYEQIKTALDLIS